MSEVHRLVDGHDGRDFRVVRLEGLIGVVEYQVTTPVQVGVLELGHNPELLIQWRHEISRQKFQ